MNIVLLAILGIVLLIGLVAFGIGHKGWSWGTVAFSFLAVFAAVGFVYLAARVAERERAWREKVRRLEADVVKARDGMQLDDNGEPQPIPGESSLAALAEQKARWYRALEQVNTWRGRSWSNGVFRPPQGDQDGQVIFQLPENAAPNPFINVGSQLYLFDSESADVGGRYLGVVRVRESAVQEKELVLSVSPAAPPTDVDKKLWRREYDSVQAFEGLPVDRWLAFSRTRLPSDDKEEQEESDTEADEDRSAKPPYPVLPGLRKAGTGDESTAEDLLLDLEEQLDRFEKHETPVPEDEWRPLVEADAVPPGEYWAAVRFAFAHAMTTEAAGPEEPDTIQFEKGDSANLPLDTAIELENEGVVEIRSVFYRRPLLDMGIAMEGNKVLGKTEGDGQTLEVEVPGGYFIHGRLTSQIGQLEQSLRDLDVAKKNATDTIVTVRREEEQLNDDLPRWGKDVAVATEVREGVEGRLARAQKRLDEAWEAVIQMGRQYDGEMALLQADAEKRAGGRP
jgi:hypothetical protein